MKKLDTFFKYEGNHGEEINLQHDKNNNLYVNNKKILTEKKVKLRWIEMTLLIITTAGVFTQAIVAVLVYLKS